MQMTNCPNCGQPMNLLWHECPYCRIKIVGASGLSKLMREVGNSQVMLAGGLFLIAFLVCMALLWKLGIIDSGSSDKTSGNAASLPTLRIGQGSAETGIAIDPKPKSELSGTWTGKFINALGESGDAELIIEESGRSVTARWNGESITNLKRTENGIHWEVNQKGRLWRFDGRMHDPLILVTSQALASDKMSAASGTAFLVRDGANSSSTSDAAFAGIWTGLYADGPRTGVTAISLHEDKNGGLSGVWNGKAPIAQAKVSDGIVEWECDEGRTHFHAIGQIYGEGGKLALIFGATEGSGKNGYSGSALYSKNP
jgi:hypothetical protein